MQIKLLAIESHKQEWSELAAQTYSEKINHYLKFEEVLLKSKKLEREDKVQKVLLETTALLQKIKPDDFVILCDEKGREFGSIEFSRKIFSTFDSGKRSVIFIVGGAFGVGDELKKRANLTIKLSSMTMNHLVARVQLLEQIYRAIMIWKSKPYHNE